MAGQMMNEVDGMKKDVYSKCWMKHTEMSDSVILREEDEDGQVMVTKDNERVLKFETYWIVFSQQHLNLDVSKSVHLPFTKVNGKTQQVNIISRCKPQLSTH